MARLALFYPGTETGGAEWLLARMATALAGRGHEVVLVDGPAGVIRPMLSDPRVEYRQARTGQPVDLAVDALLSFASHLRSLDRWVRVPGQTRLLFWSVHAYNTIFLPPVVGNRLVDHGLPVLRAVNRLFFRAEDQAQARAVAHLRERQALACMDGENAETIARYYGGAADAPLLPIPLPALPAAAERAPEPAPRPLELFWYGRLCDFKTPGLLHLMADLRRSGRADGVRLHVIGDGPDRAEVERLGRESGLDLHMHGTLANAEALDLIGRQAHLVCAMGTAALEAAALQRPTLLMPPCYGQLPADYRYRWLQQAEGFSIGRFVNARTRTEGLTLAQVLDLVADPVQSTACARAGRQHVLEHHAMPRVAASAEALLLGSTVRADAYLDAVGYRRPSLVLGAGLAAARARRFLALRKP